MRSFALIALFLAFPGALALDPSTISFTVEGCQDKCVTANPSVDDLKACIAQLTAMDNSCTAAHVELTYSLSGLTSCSEALRRSKKVSTPTKDSLTFTIDLKDVLDDVKTFGTTSSLLLKSVKLGKIPTTAADCSAPKLYAESEVNCSGDGVEIKVDVTNADTNYLLTAKDSFEVAGYGGLLTAVAATASGTPCKLSDAKEGNSVVVEVNASFSLETPPPEVEQASIVFVGDDCAVDGCNAVHESSVAQDCLARASQIEGCEAMIYTRQYNGVHVSACSSEAAESEGIDAKSVAGLSVNMDAVYADEDLVTGSGSKTLYVTMLNVGQFIPDSKTCDSAALVVASHDDVCTTTDSTPSKLTLDLNTASKSMLAFDNGEDTMDLSQQPFYRVDIPAKDSTKPCQLTTKSTAANVIQVETTYQIEQSSGSLPQLSLAGFIMTSLFMQTL